MPATSTASSTCLRTARARGRRSQRWAACCARLSLAELERPQAVLGAEVLAPPSELPVDRPRPVHPHPARGVRRAAAMGEPEEGGEDREPEDVQEQLVIE